MLNWLQLMLELQMIKLLKHEAALSPFYITLSKVMRFQALYADISIRIAKSIRSAINSMPNKQLNVISSKTVNWGCLIPESPASSIMFKQVLVVSMYLISTFCAMPHLLRCSLVATK